MKYKISTILSLLLVLSSCTRDKIENEEQSMKKEVVKNFANIVKANYSDALEDAKELQIAIERFTSNPNVSSHESAKYAWLNSRESYGQTETFRFMDGPIDNTNGPEGNLNAWPLDEAYIDYVYDVATHSIVNNGLIADSTFEITTANLKSVNEDGGETNISIGYHALEFLLWGQDLNYDPVSNSSNNFDVSGQRTYSDYSTEPFADRRKKYLNVTAQILVDDLTYLVNAWEKDAWGETAFLSKSPDQAITEIMTGMAMLSKGELAGERMFVAVNNRDQEDEHSCFSDNTHRDIYTNALGIKNVYLGSYGSISGASIQDLLKNQNKELEEKLSAQFNSTWETIEAVNTHAPFDAQLLEETVTGNGVIMTAVHALQKQGDYLVEAAAELGLKISADLEE